MPANPAVDPYFPIGQTALSLVADARTISVSLKTMTPNFQEYQVRIDGIEWKPCQDRFGWSVHPGSNRLEARTINQFRVEGPVSTAQMEVSR